MIDLFHETLKDKLMSQVLYYSLDQVDPSHSGKSQLLSEKRDQRLRA